MRKQTYSSKEKPTRYKLELRNIHIFNRIVGSSNSVPRETCFSHSLHSFRRGVAGYLSRFGDQSVDEIFGSRRFVKLRLTVLLF